MAQLQLFTSAQIAGMRDRTAPRRQSTAHDEFRRAQQHRRDWGLLQRHTTKVRRSQAAGAAPPPTGALGDWLRQSIKQSRRRHPEVTTGTENPRTPPPASPPASRKTAATLREPDTSAPSTPRPTAVASETLAPSKPTASPPPRPKCRRPRPAAVSWTDIPDVVEGPVSPGKPGAGNGPISSAERCAADKPSAPAQHRATGKRDSRTEHRATGKSGAPAEHRAVVAPDMAAGATAGRSARRMPVILSSWPGATKLRTSTCSSAPEADSADEPATIQLRTENRVGFYMLAASTDRPRRKAARPRTAANSGSPAPRGAATAFDQPEPAAGSRRAAAGTPSLMRSGAHRSCVATKPPTSTRSAQPAQFGLAARCHPVAASARAVPARAVPARAVPARAVPARAVPARAIASTRSSSLILDLSATPHAAGGRNGPAPSGDVRWPASRAPPSRRNGRDTSPDRVV